MEETNQRVDGKTQGVNDCMLGDDRPNTDYQSSASEFIKNTSLDDMHAIAEAALRKKMEAPPKWVFPEGGIQPGQQ